MASMDLQVFFILFFPFISYSYNINDLDLADLKGDSNPDSLFGWSIQHFNNHLYVGAPNEGGKGAVYECSNINNLPSCSKMSTPRTVMPKSWYGGSLAASSSNLYTCAFRHGYQQYSPQKQYIGKCFEKNGGSFNDLIDFASRWSNEGGSTWKTNGIYGVSATVSDKTGKLVVGTPITFDNKGMWNSPYISAGSIGLIKRAGTLVKPRNNAPWVTTDTDTSTMKNTFKSAGYSLTTGSFFSGNPKSYVVGAPKANNYRGSVYVCPECFGERFDRARLNVRFPEATSNLEVIGLQMGEGFGSAIAACDISGDGRDDLIVGAPNHSPRRQMFNVGRIHIFIKRVGGGLRRVSSSLSTLGPEGNLDDQMGARFGSAVACLGDTDGDEAEEIVVGAPYFGANGAIFLYRANQDRTGLVLSQVVKSKTINAAFGLRLSSSKLKEFSSQGFAVGAPRARSSSYVKVRNVARFTDISQVTISPRSIDPEKTKQVMVTITPAIQRRTQFSQTLRVKATILTDSRLQLVNQNDETDLTGDVGFGRQLTFAFQPRDPNFGVDPRNLNINDRKSIVFKINLDYTIGSCTDSFSNPCPVFDPLEKTNGQKTDPNMKKISKQLRDRHVDFNFCEDSNSCLCDVKADIVKERRIVAGASDEMTLGGLKIENQGAEPSFYTNVEVTIDKTKYTFKSIGNCFYNSSIASCDLPFLNSRNEQNSKRNFPLRVSPIELIHPDTEFVKMKLKVTSKNCKSKNDLVKEEDLTILIDHEWSIRAEQSKEQESQTFIWDQKIETEETQNSETVELSYNIYNEGPSMSKESKLYTFIPTYSDLVANPQVEFIGQKCVKGDLSKNQKVPDPPRTSAANGEVIVCHNRGDCDVYECNLPKAMEKREKLNLRIKYDFMKKHAKKMEKVTRFQIVTSICTMNHKQGKNDRCVDNGKTLKTTTSFEYIKETILSALIDSWQLIVGGIAGLIVFLIIFVIFYKCQLFNKVRFYKNMGDTEDLIDENGEESKNLSEMEVDGENIELRT